MTKGEEILRLAATQVGYHEGPNHANKYGAWFGMDNVAWCMEFVSWCYCQAGIHGPKLGLTRKQGGTASCGELLRWYQRYQPDCITDNPVRGCVVIFDFPDAPYDTDHTGLFVSKTSSKITTIDGNTSNKSEGNGGWVQQRTRALSYARPTYIVPRELEDDYMDIDKFIDKITPEQTFRLASKLYDADLYKLYSRVESYMDKMPLPTTWPAQEHLDEAVAMGITDGTRPMVPARRYEAALMAMRAAEVQNG